jgi:hypothetical protein
MEAKGNNRQEWTSVLKQAKAVGELQRQEISKYIKSMMMTTELMTMMKALILNFIPTRIQFFRVYTTYDRLCGLVVRVPGYKYRGPGFYPTPENGNYIVSFGLNSRGDY